MTAEELAAAKRFEELARRAYDKGIVAYTNFLSMNELAVLASLKKSLAYVPCGLWGGMEGCERQMARFGDPGPCGCEEPFPIACVKISPTSRKFADVLTHRDFLGALMNLGIERDTLGDVMVKENEGYVFCTQAIAPYVIESLTQVKRTAVGCAISPAPQGELFSLAAETVRVSSPRADAVIARAYHLSREDSLELFRTAKVFVNSALQENNSAQLRQGDVVSVRGFGRFVFRGVAGTSKKGKLNVAIEKYQS